MIEFLFVIITLAGFINGIIVIIKLFSSSKNSTDSSSSAQATDIKKHMADVFADELKKVLVSKKETRDDKLQKLHTQYLQMAERTNDAPEKETDKSDSVPTFDSASYEEIVQEQGQESAKQEELSNRQSFGDMLGQWYQHNTVSFLLYLGAFLIVVSAITFLTFTWGSLNDGIRFGSFALVTAAFFGAGYYFFRKPDVSEAGVTFMGISALLLPLNGISYQLFLMPEGSSGQSLWLITSIICLAFYIFLFRLLPSRFYMTVVHLSSLSLVLANISLFTSQYELFIFGAVIVSFVIFLANFALLKKYGEDLRKYNDLSSHVLLIISLIFGILFLLQKGNLFVWEATITLFLTSGYYTMRYFLTDKTHFIPAHMFLYATIFFLVETIDMYGDVRIYILLTASIVFLLPLTILKRIYSRQGKELIWGQNLTIVYFCLNFLQAFFFLLARDSLTTVAALLVCALSFLYWIVVFFHGEKKGYIIAHIFLFLSTLIGAHIIDMSHLTISYIILAWGVIHAVAYRLIPDNKRFSFVRQTSLHLATVYGFFSLLFALAAQVEPAHITWLVLGSSVLMALLFALSRAEYFLFLLFTLIPLFILLFNRHYTFSDVSERLILLPYFYSIAASSIVLLYRHKHTYQKALVYGVIVNLVASYLTNAIGSSYGNQLIISLVNVGILVIFTIRWHHAYMPFLPVIASYLSVYYFIHLVEQSHALAFNFFLTSGTIFAAAPMLSRFLFPNDSQKLLRMFAMSVCLFIAVIDYPHASQDPFNSLLNTLGFGFSALLFTEFWREYKHKGTGYLAAFLWMVTSLRIFNNAGLTDSQFYIQPFATYIIGCGLYQHWKKRDTATILILIGMVISVLPLFAQSYGENGMAYATFLGFEGLIYIAGGITLKQRELRLGGVTALALALFSQTGSYIFSLPKWILIGLLGISILVAATLLMKRGNKEKGHDGKNNS